MDEKARKKLYSGVHKTLLVGEGDFSFTLSLAKRFGAANITATSLDTREELEAKYKNAKANVKELEERGCTIIHEVNVHTMDQHPLLRYELFDRIVYNFPHAGFFSESDSRVISRHQDLVRGYFKSARKMLRLNGEVLVTHKTTHPFSKWDLENLAEREGLYLVGKVPFSKKDYPGYTNKRGSGGECDSTFPIGEASIFRFGSREIEGHVTMASEDQIFDGALSSTISMDRSLVSREIKCFCKEPAKLLQSWTNENPGRRFYECGNFEKSNGWCKFFRWHDVEEVTGWPKDALIEAQNQIREKNGEIKELSYIISQLEEDKKNIQTKNETYFGLKLRAIEFDVAKLRQENNHMELENDMLKQKLLKQTIIATELQNENEMLRSSLGFSWVLTFGIVVVSYFMNKK